MQPCFHRPPSSSSLTPNIAIPFPAQSWSLPKSKQLAGTTHHPQTPFEPPILHFPLMVKRTVCIRTYIHIYIIHTYGQTHTCRHMFSRVYIAKRARNGAFRNARFSRCLPLSPPRHHSPTLSLSHSSFASMTTDDVECVCPPLQMHISHTPTVAHTYVYVCIYIGTLYIYPIIRRGFT